MTSTDPEIESETVIGAKLARFAEQAEAALRRCDVEPLQRCASCAFRGGTVPNTKSLATALDALKCLIEHHPFGCHHGKKDGLPTRLCAGYVNILAADENKEPSKAPWPFSDELFQERPEGSSTATSRESGERTG